MSRIVISTAELDPADPEPDEGLTPLVTYDPEDPDSIARTQQVIMKRFQLSSPPPICGRPEPARHNGFIQLLRTWLGES